MVRQPIRTWLAEADEIISNGYNLIGDGTGGTITPATGDQIGTCSRADRSMLDPLARQRRFNPDLCSAFGQPGH